MMWFKVSAVPLLVKHRAQGAVVCVEAENPEDCVGRET